MLEVKEEIIKVIQNDPTTSTQKLRDRKESIASQICVSQMKMWGGM